MVSGRIPTGTGVKTQMTEQSQIALNHIITEIDRIQMGLDIIRRNVSDALQNDDAPISIEIVKQRLAQAISEGGKEFVKQTLKEHGANKVSELKETEYKSVMKEVSQWLNIPF